MVGPKNVARSGWLKDSLIAIAIFVPLATLGTGLLLHTLQKYLDERSQIHTAAHHVIQNSLLSVATENPAALRSAQIRALLSRFPGTHHLLLDREGQLITQSEHAGGRVERTLLDPRMILPPGSPRIEILGENPNEHTLRAASVLGLVASAESSLISRVALQNGSLMLVSFTELRPLSDISWLALQAFALLSVVAALSIFAWRAFERAAGRLLQPPAQLKKPIKREPVLKSAAQSARPRLPPSALVQKKNLSQAPHPNQGRAFVKITDALGNTHWNEVADPRVVQKRLVAQSLKELADL